MGDIIRVVMVGMGIVIFVLNLFSLAKRRMAPMFSVVWSIVALAMIVLGIALRLSVLKSFMSWSVLILLLFIFSAVIISFYLISLEISKLIAQNHELTMQVSLLNEENRDARRQAGEAAPAPEEEP